MRQRVVRFNGIEGEDLVLRPDHTAAIARIVGSRLSHSELPIKYYYLDPIFRRNNKGEDVETISAGVEVIGDGSVEADALVIGTAIDAMRFFWGFLTYVLILGMQGYVASLSQAAQNALRNGDYTAGIPPHGDVSVVHDVPQLVGASWFT